MLGIELKCLMLTCINQTGPIPDSSLFWFRKGGAANKRIKEVCSESMKPENDGCVIQIGYFN